jgi:hypothetical protein
MEWLMVILLLGGAMPATSTVGPFASEDLCKAAAEKIGRTELPGSRSAVSDYALVVCVRSK